MDRLTKEQLQEVVEQHTGLVKSVAYRLAKSYGMESEDLVQIGYIGLIKAAQRFEPERGLQFSTYAVPMIMGEIKTQVRSQDKIHMSRGLKSDLFLVKREVEALTQNQGLSPHISQLKEKTGLTEERIQQALLAAEAISPAEEYDPQRLDVAREDWKKDEELEDIRIDFIRIINELKKEERQVVLLRYYRDYTQQQVGKLLGISQVQVCRIEKKALKKLASQVVVEG